MTNDKEKNGFTLIELLAVIVILAVIALIAVPRIIEILNKSRLSAAEDSTYGIVEAAESYVASFMLQNHGAIPSEDLKFSCNSEGCTLVNELTNYNTENLKTLEFKGKKPTGGAITISENGNKVTVYGLLINNFICNYGDGDADCIDSNDIGATKENPTTESKGFLSIIYLDPTDFTHKCTSEDVDSDTGTKKGCMKWYAYAEDDIQNTYTMILDHNTTALVAWNLSGINSEMKEAKTQLESDTQEWNKSLNVRLISAEEIAEITGASKSTEEGGIGWTLQSSWFFLDGAAGTDENWQTPVANSDKKSKYAWLFDNTMSCLNYGCNITQSGNHGYWLSSSDVGSSNYAWFLSDYGRMGCNKVIVANSYGIRPVITISKSLIKN